MKDGQDHPSDDGQNASRETNGASESTRTVPDQAGEAGQGNANDDPAGEDDNWGGADCRTTHPRLRPARDSSQAVVGGVAPARGDSLAAAAEGGGGGSGGGRTSESNHEEEEEEEEDIDSVAERARLYILPLESEQRLLAEQNGRLEERLAGGGDATRKTEEQKKHMKLEHDDNQGAWMIPQAWPARPRRLVLLCT